MLEGKYIDQRPCIDYFSMAMAISIAMPIIEWY
jgi:hypothetical protein